MCTQHKRGLVLYTCNGVMQSWIGGLFGGQSRGHVISRLTAADSQTLQLRECCRHNPPQPPPAAQGRGAQQLRSSLGVNSCLDGSRRGLLGGGGQSGGGLSGGGLGGSRLLGGGGGLLDGRSGSTGGFRFGPKLSIHLTQGQLLHSSRRPPDGDVLANRGGAVGACGAHKALALPPHNAGDAGAQGEVGGGGGALPRLRANLRMGGDDARYEDARMRI